LITKLEEIDRKGLWSVRVEEAKAAGSIIEAKHLEKAPPMPQQQSAA
jgi:hypothetical protein